MSYRVIKVSDLMAYEFSKIEGAYKRLRQSDIEKVLPQGMTVQALNEKLHEGQFLPLSDSPLVLVLIISNANSLSHGLKGITTRQGVIEALG